jgi:hypothetical protein
MKKRRFVSTNIYLGYLLPLSCTQLFIINTLISPFHRYLTTLIFIKFIVVFHLQFWVSIPIMLVPKHSNQKEMWYLVETIVPIGTKPYRIIVWKSSIYNFHSAAINWQTKNTTIRTVPKSNIKIVERGKWIPQHTNTITWPLAWYRHFNTKWHCRIWRSRVQTQAIYKQYLWIWKKGDLCLQIYIWGIYCHLVVHNCLSLIH